MGLVYFAVITAALLALNTLVGHTPRGRIGPHAGGR